MSSLVSEKRTVNNILLTVLCGFILTGCQDHLFGEANDTGPAEAGAGYPTEISDVFSNNSCTNAGCHGGGSSSGGVSLDAGTCEATTASEAVVSGDASASSLWTEIDEGTMPIGGDPVTQEEIDAIAAWINDGASCSTE